jgi:hypothetical protein
MLSLFHDTSSARLRRTNCLADSVVGVSGTVGEWNSLWLATPGRSRVTEDGGAGRGFQPAIVRTCARAFALSVIPGNRRRSSIAAESSPSWSKMARIASASASVTRNIPQAWWPAQRWARGCRLVSIKYVIKSKLSGQGAASREDAEAATAPDVSRPSGYGARLVSASKIATRRDSSVCFALLSWASIWIARSVSSDNSLT